MNYRGTILGGIFFVLAVIFLNGLLLAGAAGVVIALFSISVTFNWAVFWWLVFGFVASLFLAFIFSE